MVSKRSFNQKFGDVLREARQAANITQEELAFRADLHRTYISLLERGLRSPTLESLFRICEALGEEPESLVGKLHKHLRG
jgi:transcriptional regulator with XRE-family HTH domain